MAVTGTTEIVNDQMENAILVNAGVNQPLLGSRTFNISVDAGGFTGYVIYTIPANRTFYLNRLYYTSSQACPAGHMLKDTLTNLANDFTDALLRNEAVAANTMQMLDFSSSPLIFKKGVAIDSGFLAASSDTTFLLLGRLV